MLSSLTRAARRGGEASISQKLVTTSHFSSVTTNICLLAISVRLNYLMVIPRGYSLFPNLTVISAPAAAQTFDQHILASVVRRLNTVLLIKFNCLLPLNDCLLTFCHCLDNHQIGNPRHFLYDRTTRHHKYRI